MDTHVKIDLRTATYEIPPQEILTKDSVTVFVNAIMYYKVRDATSAVSNVDDYGGSARLLAATTLRCCNERERVLLSDGLNYFFLYSK